MSLVFLVVCLQRQPNPTEKQAPARENALTFLAVMQKLGQFPALSSLFIPHALEHVLQRADMLDPGPGPGPLEAFRPKVGGYAFLLGDPKKGYSQGKLCSRAKEASASDRDQGQENNRRSWRQRSQGGSLERVDRHGHWLAGV